MPRRRWRGVREAVALVWSTGPKQTTLLTVFSLVQAVLPFLGFYATKLLLDAVAGAVRENGSDRAARDAVVFAAAAAGIFLFGAVARAVAGLLAEERSRAVADRVLAVVQERAALADLSSFDDPDFHDALHRATQEAPTRSYGVIDGLLRVARSLIGLVLSGLLLVPLHASVAAVVFVAAVPAAFARLRAARELERRRAEDAPREREAAYVGAVLSGPAHAKEVRAFDLGPRLAARFAALRVGLGADRLALLKRQAFRDVSAQIVGSVAVFGAAAYAAAEAARGRITLGDFALYVQSVQAAAGAVGGLVGGAAVLFEHELLLDAYRRFRALRPKTTDPARPAVLPTGPTEIVFEDVSFTYPGAARPALDGFSLRIRAGERVAVVGPNGAGKSTLVKLICRLVDPERGVVRFGGTDARDFRLSDLRRLVAPVFQDFARYEFTVREILALGSPEAAADEPRLRAALKAAGADGFVAGMADGLDARLGGRFRGGRELSVGEWQKLALARAFIRDAGVLVLDEPASALDAAAEADIADRVRTGASGRTVVVVSHRWSTVAAADRVLVVEGGRLVEDGPPAVLLARGGACTKLFERSTRA